MYAFCIVIKLFFRIKGCYKAVDVLECITINYFVRICINPHRTAIPNMKIGSNIYFLFLYCAESDLDIISGLMIQKIPQIMMIYKSLKMKNSNISNNIISLSGNYRFRLFRLHRIQFFIESDRFFFQ